MKILNLTKNTFIAQNVQMADTAVSRLVGLLKHESLSSDEALIITQCRSIHMFFMRFAIDAIFADKNNTVVGIVKGIKPFRMSPYFFRASYVVEAPVGTVDHSKTALGDKLSIV